MREGYLLIRPVVELSEEDKDGLRKVIANTMAELRASDVVIPFELSGVKYTISMHKDPINFDKFRIVKDKKSMYLMYAQHTILKIGKDGKLLLADGLPPTMGIHVNEDGVITIAETDKEDE